MMAHLNDVEVVDLLEGRLAPVRAAHAQTCARCAAQVNDLRAVLDRATEADVPEPSPLFWEHLSSRIADAVQREEPRGLSAWFRVRWAQAAFASFAVILLVGAVLWRAPRPADRQEQSTARIEASRPAGDDKPWDDIETDEAWALVRTVAEDVSWDETGNAGISAGPGTAEYAASQLSADERSELAALVREELHRRASEG